MNIEIINTELKFNVSGFGSIAENKNYAGAAFKSMDKMWPIVKGKGLKNKGLNIWVYGPGDMVFAGVELEDPFIKDSGLELKTVVLTKYAYFKHIGPYHKLREVVPAMQNEIRNRGLKSGLPYIEVYGHWVADESIAETELFMTIE